MEENVYSTQCYPHYAEAFYENIISTNFFDEIWEKKAVKFEGALHSGKSPSSNDFPPGSCSEIFPEADFLHIALNAFQDFQLFKKGKRTQAPMDPRVGYLEGNSIVINRFDRYSEYLCRACQDLASRYFSHVFAVAYLTPPLSFAVDAHSDSQDVFLLQIWGKKQWQVFEPIIKLPYAEEMLGKSHPIEKDLGEPCLECTLSVGDVLYIPRGFIHRSKTEDSCSLHITITIPSSDFCWGINVESAIHQLILDRSASSLTVDFCRRSILQKSAIASSSSPDGLQKDQAAKLNFALKDIFNNLTLEKIQGGFAERMKRINESQQRESQAIISNMKPLGQSLFPETALQLATGVTCSSISETSVTFRRKDQSLVIGIFPTAFQLIQKLADQKPVKIKDMPCKDPFERICVCSLLIDKMVLVSSRVSGAS